MAPRRDRATSVSSMVSTQSTLQLRDRLEQVLRLLAKPSAQACEAARNIVQELLQEGSPTGSPLQESLTVPFEPESDSSGSQGQWCEEDGPEEERLPFLMMAQFLDYGDAVCLSVNGEQVGNELTDKATVKDGYRFHDAFHLAHAAVLGWSPVLRALLHRRRRSKPELDEREDGGRAQMIEEAVSHVIFVYGRDGHEVHNPLLIDPAFILQLQRLTAGLEVERRGPEEWAQAVAEGWRAFDALREGRCDAVLADMRQGCLFPLTSDIRENI